MLEYHHFDPPWHVEHHHRPTAMIALCRIHHAMADAGAFTIDQLTDLKSSAPAREVAGRFEWMRAEVVILAGSNLFLNTATVLELNGQPAIWLERDAFGHVMLNVVMQTLSGQPRLVIANNDWISTGEPLDLVSPTSGKQVAASYANGDSISVTFSTFGSAQGFESQHHRTWPYTFTADVRWPITLIEIGYVLAGTGISFTPTNAFAGGQFTDCAFQGGGTAIALGY